jgi:hypothetical protein
LEQVVERDGHVRLLRETADGCAHGSGRIRALSRLSM